MSYLVVSTEDDEIAEYAESIGAEVLQHPKALGLDGAPSFPVIQRCLEQLTQGDRAPAVCVVARPTTPLRTAQDIDLAVELLFANPPADSVVSVVPAIGVHPLRLKRVLEDGKLVGAFGDEGFSPRPRQELETLFLRNGGVYVARSWVIASGRLWGSHCLAYVMPEDRSININTEFQFRVAELLMRSAISGQGRR